MHRAENNLMRENFMEAMTSGDVWSLSVVQPICWGTAVNVRKGSDQTGNRGKEFSAGARTLQKNEGEVQA
jgi:hypothetical protein